LTLRPDYRAWQDTRFSPLASVRKILEHAESQCLNQGARLTDKRKAVLTGLLQSERALSAYELIDYCRDQLGEKLPPMSIYRILEFLEAQQLVHKLKLANRFVACTHITCDHRHEVPQFLVCTNCFRVAETSLSKSTLGTIKRNVKEVGFELVSPQLEINCLCGDCSSQ
jgi:Fur family zinc uptake transcriptional regulator